MTDETQEQQITAVGNEMSASFLAAKKRSDETLAASSKRIRSKFTMLTGDRPTGRLHIGHYFGTHARAAWRCRTSGVHTRTSSSPTIR